jgi:hypothetical protein
MLQFPLRRNEGEPITVVVHGTYNKEDLVRLFWMLSVAAMDFDPAKETPVSVIKDVLDACEPSWA